MVGFEGRFRVKDAVIGGHVVVHLVEGKGREGKGRGRSYSRSQFRSIG